MQVTHTTNPAKEAGLKMTELLEKYRETPILLLVSGGSALAILEYISLSTLGPKVTLGVLDERYDADEEINNFAQMRKTDFFEKAVLAGCSYIDTTVMLGENLKDLAFRYNNTLSKWRTENPAGAILITLGMGSDGHTAGIMPGYVEEVSWSGALAMGYELPLAVNKYPRRVTVTPRFLKGEVTGAVAYVAGEEKCAVLAQVLAQKGELEQYPALLWHGIAELTLVTTCQEQD